MPHKTIQDQEWIDSLDYVLKHDGAERAEALLRTLRLHLRRQGLQP
ncbi:MAG: hypothetical protein PVI86_03980 [Phycisphaerae bacterium]|jgi:pyruvate dehydrogenase complex dehydrogenase (E1) component